jgi:glycosyltransferase involved in cell wall biosynthesis
LDKESGCRLFMFYLKFETIQKMKISAVIIAFNEEKKIAQAIKSVGWADEILLIDSESTDRTREIAEQLGAKVVVQKWLGFSKQKQFGCDLAQNDWIFSLDADEIVSDELTNLILQLKKISNNQLADGYKIPRLSFYINRPIRHSGWYPDWQLRFFNRQKAKWKDVLIHESVEVEGKIEKMNGDILHHSVENALHHHQMIGERYAKMAAQQMFEQGKRTSPIKIYTVGLITFIQVFLLKFGFLDGLAGFCIAWFASQNSFLKHLILWELQNQKDES